MSFETLGLHPLILEALADVGYKTPTPVQQQAIPAVLANHDLLVSSRTGSGKTAAFMLPILQQFALLPESARNKKTQKQERQAAKTRGETFRFKAAEPKVLVLTPTRELALQITTATTQYTAYMKHIHTVAILGGMPYPRQMQMLAKNPHILVATPGRLMDHLRSGKINLSHLQTLVLDEADRMLDMGFIEDIETIVEATPPTRQTLLFSATLDGIVGKMAERITRHPQIIRIAAVKAGHENIAQSLHFVDNLTHKNRILDHLLRDTALNQALVFTATKRDADTVADQLNIAGFSAAALHGDMHQGARNRTLDNLRRGRVKILVATDVAARGIDIPTITHVFNYDLPKFPEDYVHRIGRTGRAGKNGMAISLVNYKENKNVKRIERFIKQSIPINVIEGFEPRIGTEDTQKKPAPGRRGMSKKGLHGRSGPRGPAAAPHHPINGKENKNRQRMQHP
ncbi:MAG: DEAD/DEAH box helicase [Burkholderiaceae bacterium]|nr:DEAD/DEAH box helicase [Burkholderiaceae bacterium]